MSIGQRLKEARQAAKMTQPELADAVGVSKGAIGNYETDVSSPNEPILIRLMDVLHIDANFLYQDYIQIEEKISSEEHNLLSAYRNAEPVYRKVALDILLANPMKKDTLSEAE